MKGSILYLVLFISTALNAQIGINTENPIGIFNIDAGGNNTTVQANRFSDDIVILNNGNVGIGTNTPNNKLSIATTGANTGLQLTNGRTLGHVLTSDADGNGTWRPESFSEFTIKDRVTVNLEMTPTQSKYKTGLSFDFPSVGTYSVTLHCTMRRVTGTANLRDRPVLQILPNVADNLTSAQMQAVWTSSNVGDRFIGSYEIMGIPRNLPAGTNHEYRFIFNEVLVVDENTGLTAYLILHNAVSENQTFNLKFGTPGTDDTEPQVIGCSFLKIN